MQASNIVSTPQSRTSVCWINSPNSFSTGYTALLFNYRKTIKSSWAIQQPRTASFYMIRKPWHRSVQVQLKLHKEHFISHFEAMLSSRIRLPTKATLRGAPKILSKFTVSKGCQATAHAGSGGRSAFVHARCCRSQASCRLMNAPSTLAPPCNCLRKRWGSETNLFQRQRSLNYWVSKYKTVSGRQKIQTVIYWWQGF